MSTRVLALASVLLPFLWGALQPSALHAQAPGVPTPADTTWQGSWEGALDLPGAELRVVFHLNQVGPSLQGTMDSPDQGVTGIDLDTVTTSGDSLFIEVASIAGLYRGRYAEDGTIRGSWVQGGASLDLILHQTDTPAVVDRPQRPEAPFPYRTEDVTFSSDAIDHTLAGTFSRPDTDRSVPAVVLVSGSGPHDRSGESMGHQTLTVIGDYLTRQGFAVLRYDERGIGASEGTFRGATTPMLADDVHAALLHLHHRDDVDTDHIGLIGHSEGGLIAGYLGARYPDLVHFMVLLGSPGVAGDAILQDQLKTGAEQVGMEDGLVDAQLRTQQRVFDIMNQTADSTEIVNEIRAVIEETSGVTDSDMIERELQGLMDPWLRFFVKYDPVTDLTQLTQPVLALIGSKDQQVRPELNVTSLEKALHVAPTPAFTVDVLDGLNHLFQTAPTGAATEYAQIAETFAPEALERIATWLHEHTAAE